MHYQRKQRKRLTTQRQIDLLQRRIQWLKIISSRYSWFRLSIVIIGILAVYLSFVFLSDWIGWFIIFFFIAGFAVVARYHRVLIQSIQKHTIWSKIKSEQIARMDLNWSDIPPPKIKLAEDKRPLDIDLNLSGRRSLHQLVDTAGTFGGSQRLLFWFIEPQPNLHQIQERQDLVKELAPLSTFRDRLSLYARLASEEDESWQNDTLLIWLKKHNVEQSNRKLLYSLILLAVTNLILFLANQLSFIPPFWLISVFVYVAIYLMNYNVVQETFNEAFDLEKMLKKLIAVFQFLEKYNYRKNSKLAELCKPFWHEEKKPSVFLKRISRILAGIAIKTNDILWLFLNLLFPLALFFTHKLNLYKQKLAPQLSDWLDRYYEIEALNSLANLANLNPQYCFPEFKIEYDNSLFWGKELGHPLLPDDLRKNNDFSFEKKGQIGIITGSNMSGKSTFLRTLGINYVLTFAGGPVCANLFQTIPVRLFTCIQIMDSVSDGISYFYAEVKRLKELLSELKSDQETPLLYLIDEIFRGTNNRERLIGSRAYVQELVKNNGIGLIATHDLELVELAAANPTIQNYHFKEDISDKKMTFDYQLQPGPCPTTNALKIMGIEGLLT